MSYRSVFVLFCILFPCAAPAVDFSGQSRTYVQSREAVDSTKLMPFYEYLNFKAENVGSQNVRFHFGGWFRYDLRNESFGSKSSSDLQYAYLSYRRNKGNSIAKLGRIPVSEGIASELVDGAYMGTDLKAGFSVAAFGGVPVEADFDGGSGDSVYGGRIGHTVPGLYRIGLSALVEKNGSAEFRKEEGMDVWFRPFDKAELLGTVLYNAITSANAQTSLYLTLGPFKNLAFRTQYLDISYKDYFTATTLDAFQLISGTTGQIDPDESLAMIGEEASYSFGKTIISVDYNKYDYDIMGSANRYGAKVAHAGAQNSGSGFAYHRMEGEMKDLQYSEYRMYTYRKIREIDVTADALMVNYDMAVSGVKNAFAIALAGRYVLSPKTIVGADIEYAKNPYYDKDVRAFLKLTYNFDLAFGAKGRN